MLLTVLRLSADFFFLVVVVRAVAALVSCVGCVVITDVTLVDGVSYVACVVVRDVVGSVVIRGHVVDVVYVVIDVGVCVVAVLRHCD